MNRLSPQAAATPAIILTGFLGSGKTTVLNHLLEQPGFRETAVLINEFGEVALDHLLVRRLDETTVLLNSGCICCTVRGDLVAALRNLYSKRFREEIPPFNRVVIETTGLADPVPIVHTFFSDLFVSSCFRLGGIVTTVDAVYAASQLDRHEEVAKQVAIADSLLVTKSDLASEKDVIRLRQRLQGLNPGALLQLATNGAVESDKLLEGDLFDRNLTPQPERWLRHEKYVKAEENGVRDQSEHGEEGHDHHNHLADVDSFCAVYDRPLAWRAVTDALEEIVASHGEALLRMKGILNIQGETSPVVMQGVQQLFHPPVRLSDWPSDDRRSRLVFIASSKVARSIRGILRTRLGPSARGL